jgi:hypothetical protein
VPRYYFHLTGGKQVLHNHKGMNRSDDAARRLQVFNAIKRARADLQLRSACARTAILSSPRTGLERQTMVSPGLIGPTPSGVPV